MIALRGSAITPINSTAGAEIGNPGVLPQHEWPRLYGWLDLGALFDEGAVEGSVVDIGTESGLNYVDIRYQGTAPDGPGLGGNALVSGVLFCPGGVFFCRDAQIVDFSVSIALVAGSISGLTAIRLALDEHAAQPGNEYLATVFSDDIKGSLLGRLQRFSADLTMTDEDCDSAACFIRIDAAADQAIDITLRVVMPAIK
jgi:hypothetical protein